jgi:hypothetical protein
MKEQQSTHTIEHDTPETATLVSATRTIRSSLIVVGGLLCCATWFYQSTPILLSALGPFLHLFAEFYITFSSLVFIAGTCLTFAYVFDELQNRHHLHVTRRQYREMQLYLYKYELAQRIPYYRHQGPVNAYMHTIRHNLFYKPPNGTTDSQ